MKKFTSGKKVFSAFAALAISVTAIGGLATLVDGNGDVNAVNKSSDVKTVVVDTVFGLTRSQTGNVYYAAPNVPNNSNLAKGTKDDPFNISDILSSSITTKLQAGDTLYVLPGIYKIDTRIRMLSTDVKGAFNKYVRIVNAALERTESGYVGSETQAILDFSAMAFDSLNRGVEIDTDYVYWYGVDIRGAGDNGMYIGGSYNTVEYSEFYNNRDTGLQLGRAEGEQNSIYQWPSYNLVKNCTSHNNYDNQTFGENADGFAAKLTVGFANVFDGCIAYRNSDDGWDLYAKTDSGNIGTVIMYNCVAFENGYLEYSRDVCNSLFPAYDTTMAYHTAENSANPYMTRDGDGNGFKLGGSIMEGDVILYNCLSYANRMHGVTDNSNPGYIKSSYVTSYNNSAMVDENGNIAAVNNVDLHSNIDVSRQTYSYNALSNVLSVRDSYAKSLDNDNYRGTVINSLLDASSKANVVKGSIEGDTINNKLQYTSREDAIVAANMFKKLPNDPEDGETLRGNGNSMVIENGVVAALKEGRVHLTYRNADHSINMGDVLAKTADGEALIESYLGSGVTAGSKLNLNGWNSYTHFYQNDLVNGDAANEAIALVERARDALTVNCAEEAVYQDFKVPVRMLNADISWTSSNEQFVKVKSAKNDVVVSSSGTESALIEVQRDPDEDKQVTLTATIKKGEASAVKEFKITLKKGSPSVGNIYVEDANGDIAVNGGKFKYIIDKFKPYREPEVRVQNGLYPDSNKLLKESEYDVKTKYMYQVNANAHAVEVKQFTPSVAGVYTVIHSVSIKGSSVASKMSYQIFIASVNGTVDFTGAVRVAATRDGFVIAGAPSSATGIIYALSSPVALSDLTVNNIKTYKGVTSYPFRDTSVSFNFKNANTSSYNVYYALANANGEITSEIYSARISRVDVDSKDKFVKIASGSALGDEVPAQTIYALTKNLDLKGVQFIAGTEAFTGVFNGCGRTLSNISADKGVFNKINGGTLMNVKINNFSLTAGTDKAGLVTETNGGDFYNIAFTNVDVRSTNARVAALIGHVGDTNGSGSDLTISQVSIVNDASHKIYGTTRVAGLIGYVQTYEHVISIDNCYVVTDIEAETKGEGGGMVASWEDKAGDTLNITQCYYSGQLKTSVAPGSSRLGGMLGYHKGGAGVLNISRCLSLAKFHIQGVERDASVKNASPIVGGFSSSARTVVSVSCCIGLMEEYNTDSDVQVFTEINLKRHSLYLTGEDFLNLDTTRWTIVVDDNPADSRDRYKAPYATLNFLGNWN